MRHHFSRKLFASSSPFSHLVMEGGFGFTAGIIGQDPVTGHVMGGAVGAQCEQMLRNLKTLLGEHGRGLGNVVRTTVYLTDYADFEVINEVYARFFDAPFPARTTLQVAGLPLGARVQIDAVVAM